MIREQGSVEKSTKVPMSELSFSSYVLKRFREGKVIPSTHLPIPTAFSKMLPFRGS